MELRGIYSYPEVVDAMEIVDDFWPREEAAGADPRAVLAMERCYGGSSPRHAPSRSFPDI